MPRANIVYWYGLQDMPKDGGGLRALAWYEALTNAGYETQIRSLRTAPRSKEDDSLLRRTKKRLIPMPLSASLPDMGDADVNIVTVPLVFRAAALRLDPATLIFDWMDLWSVNARTMGKSALASQPGGALQSAYWVSQERALVNRPAANVFAGYADKVRRLTHSSAPGYWVPTPITANAPVERRATVPAHLRIGFIANFGYPPNIMSLRNFFREYGQECEARGIAVVVAGFGSEAVKTWGVNATVLGRVDSLKSFYQDIDAAIVPIDHGGGIKAKAVEALAYGVPVFGTRHVISGFSPEWGRYVGDFRDLLRDPPAFPSVPTSEEFSGRFSQSAFDASVGQVLSHTR